MIQITTKNFFRTKQMTAKLQKLDLSLENFKIIELFDILFK